MSNYIVNIETFATYHLNKLFPLLKTYFKDNDKLVTEKYSNWLYRDNPFGQAQMVYVSLNGHWVAFMALIPVVLRRKEIEILAYYAVNALVDPKYQGQNLFSKMISETKTFVSKNNYALIGHPNKSALNMWKRARMHFQDSLRPFLAIPYINSGGTSAQRIGMEFATKVECENYLAHDLTSNDWKILVSSKYIIWRYLTHPNHRYIVQALELNGAPIGMQITRCIKPGIHLLMDQFVSVRHLQAANSQLPLITICFHVNKLVNSKNTGLFHLPLEKMLPYFFTYEPLVAHEDVLHLNLSASDF